MQCHFGVYSSQTSARIFAHSNLFSASKIFNHQNGTLRLKSENRFSGDKHNYYLGFKRVTCDRRVYTECDTFSTQNNCQFHVHPKRMSQIRNTALFIRRKPTYFGVWSLTDPTGHFPDSAAKAADGAEETTKDAATAAPYTCAKEQIRERKSEMRMANGFARRRRRRRRTTMSCLM